MDFQQDIVSDEALIKESKNVIKEARLKVAEIEAKILNDRGINITKEERYEQLKSMTPPNNEPCFTNDGGYYIIHSKH